MMRILFTVHLMAPVPHLKPKDDSKSCDTVCFLASPLYLQMHPQSIYYSLRTFVLGLREAAQRALQEYSKHRAGLEAAISAALEAAGGDEQSEWLLLQDYAGGCGVC
jgi:hypothetical protein